MPHTEDFSRHWTLDPAIVFLNHGSFGACPKSVLAAQDRYRAQLEREPVSFFVRELPPLRDAARRELARFVGADPADLVFVPNATAGVNAFLRSATFAPGDEIVATDHEYNATRNVVDFVAAASGAKTVVAHLPFPVPSEGALVASILDAVTPRTRLAVIDHVTSATGLVLPLARIVRELADRGVPVFVDGAHAPGMLPLDLSSLGAAGYTGNCHKWICAPKGAAFLHVPGTRKDSIRPPVVSHGANQVSPQSSRFHLEFDWMGTHDPTPYLAIPDALHAMAAMVPGGWPAVMAINRTLVLEGRRILERRLSVATAAPESMIGSLATVPLPGRAEHSPAGAFDTDPLQDRLFFDFGIEVPIITWPDGRRFVRISAQLYNRREHYDRLAAALEHLVGRA